MPGAEEIDYVRIADLQEFIDVPGDIDELPELVQRRHNCDKRRPDSST